MLEDNELLFTSFSNAVDWEALDAEAKELRDEKLEELRSDDPEYEPPYRCQHTEDLFL